MILNPPNTFKMWPSAQHKLAKIGIQKDPLAEEPH